ncbi:hypothetical protein EC12741_B0063 [Escherichia coli 1.2741]|nr:hypothetical protein EC12741_B0063 [Escherichia coli 1.2741]
MKEYFPGQDSYNYRLAFENKNYLFSFQMNQKRNRVGSLTAAACHGLRLPL